MSSKNVGWRDAGIRGLLGGLSLLASAVLQDRPFIALALGFIGLIFIGTALFRMCPLYTLLRIKTC
ncbi:MAG TPA: DUF2892 domain-containing protein [Gemmatimonadales bacterium]